MSDRFIPVSPDVLQRSDLAAEAILLYEFLVDQQTSADGLVYYGKPVSYAWIRSRYLRGSLSSLQRHMRELKAAGFVEATREFHGGIRIRLPRSVKWAKPAPPAAHQLSLFAPKPTPIRGGRPVDNPVEKQWKTSESTKNNNFTGGGIEPSPVAVERSEEKVKEKIRALTRAKSLPRVWKTPAELEESRQLLQKQKQEILLRERPRPNHEERRNVPTSESEAPGEEMDRRSAAVPALAG